ncbi:hypothetical protein AAMO2058_000485400 [Amorphochlora amoebiformis]
MEEKGLGSPAGERKTNQELLRSKRRRSIRAESVSPSPGGSGGASKLDVSKPAVRRCFSDGKFVAVKQKSGDSGPARENVVLGAVYLELNSKYFQYSKKDFDIVHRINKARNAYLSGRKAQRIGRAKIADGLHKFIHAKFEKEVKRRHTPLLVDRKTQMEPQFAVHPQRSTLNDEVLNYVPLGAWYDGGRLLVMTKEESRVRLRQKREFHMFLSKQYQHATNFYCYCVTSWRNIDKHAFAKVRSQQQIWAMTLQDYFECSDEFRNMSQLNKEDIFAPHSLVLISRQPLHMTMLGFLRAHFSNPNVAINPPALQEIWSKICDLKMPEPGQALIMPRIPIGKMGKEDAKDSKLKPLSDHFITPMPGDPPVLDIDLSFLLRRLHPALVIKMLNQLSVEDSLLMISSNINTLTQCVECMRALNFPVEWQLPTYHTFLAAEFTRTIFQSIQPFFFGALKHHVNYVEEEVTHQYDILVVDLDDNVYMIIKKDTPIQQALKEAVRPDGSGATPHDSTPFPLELVEKLSSAFMPFFRGSKLSLSPRSKSREEGSRHSRRLKRLWQLMKNKNQGVQVRDRKYYLEIYRECFVGVEAVEWVMKQEKVSRPVAVCICQRMLERGYMTHCVGNHLFLDDHKFYRWVFPEWAKIYQKMIEPGTGVKIHKDHAHGVYPYYFLGKDAVSWVMASRFAKSRDEAILQLQQLMASKLIRAIHKNRKFSDSTHLYQFLPMVLSRTVPLAGAKLELLSLGANSSQSTHKFATELSDFHRRNNARQDKDCFSSEKSEGVDRAWYMCSSLVGWCQSKHYVEVTEIIRYKSRGGWLVLKKGTCFEKVFGVDPRKGYSKHLKISYYLSGQRKEVTIPCPVPTDTRIQVGTPKHWLMESLRDSKIELARTSSSPRKPYRGSLESFLESDSESCSKTRLQSLSLEKLQSSSSTVWSASREMARSDSLLRPASEEKQGGEMTDEEKSMVGRADSQLGATVRERSRNVRNAVAAAFLQILNGFEYFRCAAPSTPSAGEASPRTLRDRGTRFDRQRFLKSRAPELRQFLKKFCATQAFSSFTKKTIEAWAKNICKIHHPLPCAREIHMTLTDRDTLEDPLNNMPDGGPFLHVRIRGISSFPRKRRFFGKYGLVLSLREGGGKNQTEVELGRTEMKKYPMIKTCPQYSIENLDLVEIERNSTSITRIVNFEPKETQAELIFDGVITHVNIKKILSPNTPTSTTNNSHRLYGCKCHRLWVDDGFKAKFEVTTLVDSKDFKSPTEDDCEEDLEWKKSDFYRCIMSRVPDRHAYPKLVIRLIREQNPSLKQAEAVIDLGQVSGHRNGRWEGQWVVLAAKAGPLKTAKIKPVLLLDIRFIPGGINETIMTKSLALSDEDEKDRLSDVAGLDLRRYAVMPLSEPRVSLRGHRISNHELEYIAWGVASPGCAVRALDLSINQFDVAGLSVLFLALQKSTTFLTALDLSKNRYLGSFSSKTCFSDALRKNTSLTCLKLNSGGIPDVGATTIAKSLMRNHALRWLELSYNKITHAGALALAKPLRVFESKLNILCLRGNDLGDKGVAAICDALQTNRALKRLDIQRTGFALKGALAVSKMLAKNVGLRTLDISYNRFSFKYCGETKAVKSLMDAIHMNSTLKHLKMSYCSLNEIEMSTVAKGISRSSTIRALETHQDAREVKRDHELMQSSIRDTLHDNFLNHLQDIRKNLKAALVERLERNRYVYLNDYFYTIGETYVQVTKCNPCPALFKLSKTKVICCWSSGHFAFNIDPIDAKDHRNTQEPERAITRMQLWKLQRETGEIRDMMKTIHGQVSQLREEIDSSVVRITSQIVRAAAAALAKCSEDAKMPESSPARSTSERTNLELDISRSSPRSVSSLDIFPGRVIGIGTQTVDDT